MTSVNTTVFLTPEEDAHVRNTLKGRLQKCQKLAGQPREPGDPIARLQQVTGASLMADMNFAAELGLEAPKRQRDAMVAFAVGHPYPPCIASIEDLQPMELSELRMDTHHRGRVLTVRRKAPVVQLQASSWTVVHARSSEETERLEILLHKLTHGQDILESGSMFKIKEPYFTLNEQDEPTLRIDHPSDLVLCSNGEELGDSKDGDSATASTDLARKTAKEWKEEGNAALKQQDLPLAHANYTQGLQLLTKNDTGKEELTYDLFRNRAHVNLILNRFDEAKTDALASLTGLEDQKAKDLDSKAYFRAGYAAYNLGEFQEAKGFFEDQQRLMPDHKDAAAYLRRAELRLKEQATAVYNFKKIKAGLSPGRPRVDAASFARNVKIGESTGRGRGLFATHDIGSGEIVLCEKAFCVVWGHEKEALTAMTYDGRDDKIRVIPAGLCRAIVQKLLDNPSQVEKVMDLYGDYRGLGKQLIVRDSSPVIDTFQVHDIVSRNAFGPGPMHSSRREAEEDESNASAGLWVMAAYINHSCIPNAEKECVGDLMILRATRRIRAGEEITHSYDASSDYDARSAALMNTWGFTCDCALCVAEKADGPGLRKKRLQLESEANALVERNAPVGAKMLAVAKGRRLIRSINETYNDERYKGLPRTALDRIQKWLAEATAR
ncbi:SET domain-containing [Hyphodiscus hymeniophilus]|uniref:SET domain-containing n=1 Tax=Hyphodiscus hymeniophilus TaxID=353542 RepID=A0A9P7B1A2_9HELO|nr:SET domain-containing [Hyphodiscus hymeniophilus]